MVRWNRTIRCGRVRLWLTQTLNERLGLSASIRRHLAVCPRCRSLAMGTRRLALGMSLLKSHAHAGDLHLRANRRTIAVLNEHLRTMPEAEKLRHPKHRPTFAQRIGRYTQPVGHAAACLAILLLVRAGIFNAFATVEDEANQVVQRYYAPYLDDDSA